MLRNLVDARSRWNFIGWLCANLLIEQIDSAIAIIDRNEIALAVSVKIGSGKGAATLVHLDRINAIESKVIRNSVATWRRRLRVDNVCGQEERGSEKQTRTI